MNTPQEMEMDPYAQAQAAFERGGFDTATSLLLAQTERDPTNIQAHLLIGRCMTEKGLFPHAMNVYSSLILHPGVRGHAPLLKQELDALIVETILRWAAEIENSGFPEQPLSMLSKAVQFYTGPQFSGTRIVEIVGLDEGLKRKMPVTATFAEIIQKKNTNKG